MMPRPARGRPVSDRIEITGEGPDPRVVAVAGERVTLGGGEGVTVPLVARDLPEHPLVLVATGQGYRAEAGAPGALLRINGEDLLCKDLQPGDVLSFGGLRLRWLGGGGGGGNTARGRPRPSRAGAAARSPAAAAPRAPRRRARSRGVPGWALAFLVLVLVGSALALSVKACAGSTWPRTPQVYVDLAREQYLRGNPEQALATLDFALREATGAARDQGLALQEEIRTALALRADLPALQQARTDLQELRSYADRYLAGGPVRAPARDLVRQLDAWTTAHGAVCQRHQVGRDLLQQAERLRAQHAPAAALGEPDTADDVVFAARARLRFTVRDYRSAMALLDAFLARQPGEGGDAVRAERQAMLAEGASWLEARLRLVTQLLEQGRTGDARREMAAIDRFAALPEWAERIDPVRAAVRQAGG